MDGSPRSRRKPNAPPSRLTFPRVVVLVVGWLVIAAFLAPRLDLYYEGRASFYLVPPLVLTFAYCLAHRRRATALLALVATLVVVVAIGLAALIPKATSVLAP